MGIKKRHQLKVIILKILIVMEYIEKDLQAIGGWLRLPVTAAATAATCGT